MSEKPIGRTLKDVKRILGDPGQKITSVEDIKRLVEEPLVKPVTILFNKGIITFFSTANPAFDFASIVIEPNQLSKANLELAKKRYDFKGDEWDNVQILKDINPNTQVEEVTSFFVREVNLFENQS